MNIHRSRTDVKLGDFVAGGALENIVRKICPHDDLCGPSEAGPDRSTSAAELSVAYTIIEAAPGRAAPSKTFGLDPDGKPAVTHHGAQPASGMAHRQAAHGSPGTILSELATTLEKLSARQALICAPPPSGNNAWPFVTRKEGAGRADVITRSHEHFPPPPGPVLFGLDFDVKGWPSELQARVKDAAGQISGILGSIAPDFASAACLRRASSSAGVRNRENGLKTDVNSGQHRFFVATEGRDIDRMAVAIHQRLILAGWTIGRSGGVTGVTESQQQGSRGTNLCKRTHRTAADASTGAINSVFNLGLDDTRPLAGKSAIVTYRARCGANYSPTSAAFSLTIKTSNSLIEQAVNLTNGNYNTGDNSAASAIVNLTTAWQTFSLPVTFAADVAQMALKFQAIPTGVAGAADWFEIEEVQIELGALASTFVPIDPAYSLVKAAKQYRKSYNPDVAPGTVTYNGRLAAVAVTGTIGEGALMDVDFSDNAMRAAPTVVLYSPQTGAAGMMARGSTNDIAAAAVHIGQGGFGIWNNVATVVGSAYFVHYTADARL